MKRFDVCQATGLGVAGKGRLVVILQHEHFIDLEQYPIGQDRISDQLIG